MNRSATSAVEKSPRRIVMTINENVKGALHKVASSVLMKILYVARMVRLGMLRPTTRLASYDTKWSPSRDKQLHRLVGYIWSMFDYMQEGPISQQAATVLHVVAYADADFAGCVATPRSTTG